MYARAAGESILQDHLRQAGSSAGLDLRAFLDIGDPAAYARAAAEAPRPGAITGYDRLVHGLDTPLGVMTYVPAPPNWAVKSSLLWRQGQCAHLVIVAGRCPTGPNEAMASQRTIAAGIYHWRLASTVALGQITQPGSDPLLGVVPIPTPAPVRIVGVYRPVSPTDPFWFGERYFRAHGGVQGPDTVDPLFVARGEFTSQPRNMFVQASFDYPLAPTAVRLHNATAERAAVVGLGAARGVGATVQVNTDLPAVLDQAAHERHVVNVAVLLVTVQLAVLAWLVLFQVVSDVIETRGSEIAPAKVWGHPPWSTGLFGLGEPLALIAAAVPLGLAATWGLTHAFAHAVLVPGVPVLLPGSAVVTCLVAFGGGVAAAGLAGYRTLTRPVLDQWRRTIRRPGHGRLVAAAELALAAAAAAGLAVLLTSGSAGRADDTAALLAPGLLVFAVALVGVRLLPSARSGGSPAPPGPPAGSGCSSPPGRSPAARSGCGGRRCWPSRSGWRCSRSPGRASPRPTAPHARPARSAPTGWPRSSSIPVWTQSQPPAGPTPTAGGRWRPRPGCPTAAGRSSARCSASTRPGWLRSPPRRPVARRCENWPGN